MIRNGFVRKKVDSLKLGERLKKIRSESRISLNDVSKNTKIQVKYLEYLENGEYNMLPPDVYARGLIRSYASYLGINKFFRTGHYSQIHCCCRGYNSGSSGTGVFLRRTQEFHCDSPASDIQSSRRVGGW